MGDLLIRNVVKEGAVQKMAVLKLKPACKDYLWGSTLNEYILMEGRKVTGTKSCQ